MAIEKLTEFAKTGQKNTDDLNLETGFIVNRKPARQWFNWLFNTLTLKINEIIDADFMPKSDVIDNLTTNDATKPVSAKQGKVLQDNKLGKNENAASATKLATARTINGVLFDGTANITLPTEFVVNNTLTSNSVSDALSAAQGKILNDRFINDFLNLKTESGYQKLSNGLIIQWGVGVNQNASDYAQTNAQTIIFPIAFPNKCLNLSVSTYSTEISLDAMYQITSISKTNFRTHLNTLNNGGGVGKPYFFAIGY